MGNTNTTTVSKNSNTEKITFAKILETIAEKYILTQNFQDLVKLNDINYCNKMVILTSELLNKSLTTHEIEYMVQRTKAGQDVYEKTKQPVIISTKEQLNTINNKVSPMKKKRMCMGLARFFIRISQIYAAIFMTLNPNYVYKDDYGTTHEIPLKNKHLIPPMVKIDKIYLNVCSERLNYLTKNSLIPKEDADTMFVKPEFCSYGLKPNGERSKFIEQIGIKELERLYYDVYDYDTGKFNRMSPTMQKTYDNDLRTLYSVFNDSDPKEMPVSVKSFSDIQIKLYKNTPSCQTSTNPFNIKHYGTLGDPLFKEYANHIKKMKQDIQTRQEKMMVILGELFISVTDQLTNEPKFSINPDLSIDTLDEVNKKVLKVLVEQYVSCEKDYIKGLQLYERIVESKLQTVTEEQIKNLQTQMQQTIDKVSI